MAITAKIFHLWSSFMNISRPIYLQQLINRMNNGMIKIVTGLRRCGKSYLLFELFREYLLSSGVKAENIIGIELDRFSSTKYRDPAVLLDYLNSQINENEKYYIMLDEIQMLKEFSAVLNELLHYRNVDVYVTGSNSKFLSTDILTEFRGRGDQIRIHPLSFSEFFSAFEGSKEEAWQEYFTYGGLPLLLTMKSDEQKITYLNDLFEMTYIKDIKERNKIRYEAELGELLDILASSTGSLTNPQKLSNTFKSKRNSGFAETTITRYCSFLENAFIISKGSRYDVKGKKYINSPYKYYFMDLGLRNARLNFRQFEKPHLMENLIYNELRIRGYNVDVGIVPSVMRDNDGRQQRSHFEIDFICNMGSKRYYIQSAYRMETDEKVKQEKSSLLKINDSFKKIIIIGDESPIIRDDNGITIMNVYDFLLKNNSLEL